MSETNDRIIYHAEQIIALAGEDPDPGPGPGPEPLPPNTWRGELLDAPFTPSHKFDFLSLGIPTTGENPIPTGTLLRYKMTATFEGIPSNTDRQLLMLHLGPNKNNAVEHNKLLLYSFTKKGPSEHTKVDYSRRQGIDIGASDKTFQTTRVEFSVEDEVVHEMDWRGITADLQHWNSEGHTGTETLIGGPLEIKSAGLWFHLFGKPTYENKEEAPLDYTCTSVILELEYQAT